MYTRDKFSKIKPMTSKKAVSVIIGYILLVTFAIILGFIIYKWMKIYVPQEEISCQDKVSLYVESYELKDGMLTVHLKNNGNFYVGGYYIRATDSPENQIATIDLTQYNIDSDSILSPKGIKFGDDPLNKNSLGPNQRETDVYDLTAMGGVIYSLEIVPITWQTENRKTTLVGCNDVKIIEEVKEYAPCVPQSAQTTCDLADVDCGTQLNNCDLEVDCGSCTGSNVCNSNGQCVDSTQCTDTCTSLGWNCGGPVCGQDCGNCNLAHALTSSCDVGTCKVVDCNSGWYDCDLNPTNGCEARLGTDENCGICGDNCQQGYTCDGVNCVAGCNAETNAEFCERLGKDCGSLTADDNCGNSRTVTNCGTCTSPATCQGGVCITSTCNGVWSTPENVACDGTPLPTNCLAGCACAAGYESDGLGGCGIPTSVQSCGSYCVWLTTPVYTGGTCRQSSAQCTGNGETHQIGGDVLPYCDPGNPVGDTCCCRP